MLAGADPMFSNFRRGANIAKNLDANLFWHCWHPLRATEKHTARPRPCLFTAWRYCDISLTRTIRSHATASTNTSGTNTESIRRRDIARFLDFGRRRRLLSTTTRETRTCAHSTVLTLGKATGTRRQGSRTWSAKTTELWRIQNDQSG